MCVFRIVGTFNFIPRKSDPLFRSSFILAIRRVYDPENDRLAPFFVIRAVYSTRERKKGLAGTSEGEVGGRAEVTRRERDGERLPRETRQP